MIKPYISAFFIIFCTAIVESSIFSNIYFLPVVPDFILIFSVYMALYNGRVFGQVTGFFSGLTIDFLTGTPLGFNALIRTLIGYIYGIFNKRVIIGKIVIPVFTVATATILKAFLIWLITVFFPIRINTVSIFSLDFIFELGANIVLAPLFFRFISHFDRSLTFTSIQDLKENV